MTPVLVSALISDDLLSLTPFIPVIRLRKVQAMVGVLARCYASFYDCSSPKRPEVNCRRSHDRGAAFGLTSEVCLIAMGTHANQSSDEASPFSFFDSFLYAALLIAQNPRFEVTANGHERLTTPIVSGAWEGQTTLLA